MEFHIVLTAQSPRADVIQDALFELDPGSLVDLDMSGLTMRISSWLPMQDVIGALHRAGWAVAPEDVVELPSICCGGCGG